MFNFTDEQKKYLEDTYGTSDLDSLEYDEYKEIENDLLFSEVDEVELAEDDESKLSERGKIIVSIIDVISKASA